MIILSIYYLQQIIINLNQTQKFMKEAILLCIGEMDIVIYYLKTHLLQKIFINKKNQNKMKQN